MKTDPPNLTNPSLKKSYQVKKSIPDLINTKMHKKNDAKDGIKDSPDYKLDLSAPKLPSPKLPDVDSGVKEIVKDKISNQVKEKVRHGTLKKNLVIFIKGLDLFSSPSKSESGYAGVGQMAESVEDAKVFKWNEKEKIIDEILKIHPDHKIILVGHSLGGDTAVEIADELDTLENNFKKIDLLVTMDAVGMSNDIIPQNVSKHLNVFGESSLFLNDGPHVARRNEKTNVLNILSSRDHTEIDDDKEVQYEVINLIHETLSKKVTI